ncbi:MAG: hypothetical protein KY462_02350 [Actinobacteria bacterium]|nr:hypothetical protein [Actinomycetota bacterium]
MSMKIIIIGPAIIIPSCIYIRSVIASVVATVVSRMVRQATTPEANVSAVATWTAATSDTRPDTIPAMRG